MRTFNTVLSIFFCASLVACGDPSKDSGVIKNLDDQVLGDEGEARNENRNMTRDTIEDQSLDINLGEIALPTDASVSIETPPSNGEVLISESQFAIYQPISGFLGNDEFKYSVLQANGQKDIYTIAINVAAKIPVVSAKITVVQVTRWKNDATAAYTIIHDDLCAWDVSVGSMFLRWRELSERNLVAGYGVIAGSCGENEFTEMHKMVDAGMEMVNHSYSHIDLDLDENVTEWDTEMDLSTEILRQQGFDVNYFVFPFDSFNEAMFQRLNNNLGYLGSRGGRRDNVMGVVNSDTMNADDVIEPFRNRFDIYNELDPPEFRFSAYAGGNPLDEYVDDAINQGGWALRELHGIEFEASWGNVPLVDYLNHLDYVQNLVAQNSLWVGTPTDVTRYRASRTYCGDAVISEGTINFTTPTAAGCQKYATPLSVIVTVDNQATIKAVQNGKELPIESITDLQYMLNIDPTKGATEFISE